MVKPYINLSYTKKQSEFIGFNRIPCFQLQCISVRQPTNVILQQMTVTFLITDYVMRTTAFKLP